MKGTLKHWSVLERVGDIEVPVLLLNGKYDEAQDSCISAFFERLTKVKWVQFANSTHLAQFEEPERYLEVVTDFLRN